MATIGKILLVGLVLYAALHAYLYFNQRQLMYFPATGRVTPQQTGLPDVSEVTLRTDAGVALTSWYGTAQPGRPTLLFFHGNGGAVGGRGHRFRQFMAAGYGVFMLGYPGYGGNAGEPSQPAFAAAAQQAYDYLVSTGVSAKQIVLYGESIGSGVAVPLAAHNEARALILEAPFSSAVDAASHHYPFFMVGALLQDRFDSIAHIAGIDMPLLILHGSEDRIIPIELGRKLYQQARQPKQFLELAGAGHNDLQLYGVDRLATEFIDALETE